MDTYLMSSCTVFFKDDSFSERWINTGLNSVMDKWCCSLCVHQPAAEVDGNCL